MDLSLSGDWKYEYKALPRIKTEEDIKEYVKVAEEYFPKWATKEYKRVEIPKFSNPIAQETWEFEEIRRCIQGHDGLPGRMYFYYHYCSIQNISGGFIKPQFRVADAIWFHLVESCEWGNYNQGTGIICVKRRRSGFSWKQACDALWEALFKQGSQIAMISKDEDSSKDLLDKVYIMEEQLPSFLKHPKAKRSMDGALFARKEKDEDTGDLLLTGNRSKITVRAPSDTCLEGLQAGKLVIDEVGKIPNVKTIVSMAGPILMEEMNRVGVLIMFGTAGEQEKDGVGQKDFWVNHKSHDLQRFFFPGWAGMSSDKFGNDDIEKAVRYILKEREKRLAISEKDYTEYVQQYPLYVEEAFLSSGQNGIGHYKNIRKQLEDLDTVSKEPRKGKYVQDTDGSVSFVPNSVYEASGKAIMWETPNPSKDYVAGCDPADHDHVTKGSDLSLYIMSKQKGLTPPQIVFSMTFRTENVDDWYQQAAWALESYNNTKVLVENNRFGMIKWFQNTGYMHLLRYEPSNAAKLIKGKPRSVGVRATASSNKEMERCINDYTTKFCDLILDTELLTELGVYGVQNTDRVFAWGWCLVALEDEYISQERKEHIKQALPKTQMRMIRGKLTRVRRKR